MRKINILQEKDKMINLIYLDVIYIYLHHFFLLLSNHGITTGTYMFHAIICDTCLVSIVNTSVISLLKLKYKKVKLFKS